MSEAVEHDETPETYDGRLEIRLDGSERLVVGVHLSGFFQPIDGSFRWHGRTEPDEAVAALADRVGRREIAVRVPGGAWVGAHLAERNPWGGYRIAGTGRPPFEVEPIEVSATVRAG